MFSAQEWFLNIEPGVRSEYHQVCPSPKQKKKMFYQKIRIFPLLMLKCFLIQEQRKKLSPIVYFGVFVLKGGIYKCKLSKTIQDNSKSFETWWEEIGILFLCYYSCQSTLQRRYNRRTKPFTFKCSKCTGVISIVLQMKESFILLIF